MVALDRDPAPLRAARKIRDLLFSIAHNCAIDLLRRDVNLRSALPAFEGDAPPEPEVPEHQRPDREAEFNERQSLLLCAMAELPPEQREAFLLREETGLSIEDIARVTDVPLETAKSRLRYAIRKLKKSLQDELPAAAVALRTYA